MPKIVEECPYDGVMERVSRLGLGPALQAVKEVLTGFDLRVREERDANGGAAVRKLIDAQFERQNVGQQSPGWVKTVSGGIDWKRCHQINGTSVCIGVEIQFSARSDLLVMDIIHLRKAITAGEIDVGILVVPTDGLSHFLTDRGPCLSDAKRHVKEARADDLPLLLIALEHDGPGPALAKQAKKSMPRENA